MKYFTFQVRESPQLRVLSGWLFAIVLLSTMTAVLVLNRNDKLKLERVQVLFRHGERTPNKLEYSRIPYVPLSVYEPYGLGQLTNTGRMQAYELGLILQKRYQNFIGDVYNATDLRAYSSDSDRTMTTLQLVLAGLYPPTSAFLWNPDLKWLPISHRYIPARFDVMFRPMMGQSFGEIFRRETDHLGGYRGGEIIGGKMFRRFAKRPAKNFVAYNFATSIAPMVQTKNTEYADIIAIIKDEFGMDIWSDGPEDSLSGVFNALHSNNKMGIPVPEWCTHEVLERLKGYFVFDMNRFSQTQQLKRMNGGPLIKKFVDNMNVNETLRNPRKMYLFSGHDMNIFAVVSALAIEDYEYPDYASAIIIEKLRDVDNRVYVRLVGRRGDMEELRTLKLRNCEELCPIEEFLRIVQDVIPTDEEIHLLETEFKGSVTDDVFLNDPYVKKQR